MKLPKLLIVLNIIVLAIASIIALPSINTNLWGRGINIDTSSVKNILQGRFSNIRVDNSRDFMDQQLFILDMSGLNSEPAEGEQALTTEEKEEIFNNSFEIIKERIDSMEFGDYTMRQVRSDDGKFSIEIELPEDQLNASVLGTLISEGEYRFYEYDPEYVAPEEQDAAAFSFLDGKKPSEILSIDDAVQIKHYYNADILPNGGWAIRMDFGESNVDQVALAAADSQNFNDFYRRLWIVQGEIPVAIQIAPVLRDINNEPVQSEIIFASFISQDDPNSYLISKALASSLKTEPITTSIVISDTQVLDPIYKDGAIELIKLFYVVALIVAVVFSITMLKTKGWILAIGLLAQTILTISIAKFVSASITIGLILGILGGLSIFVVTIVRYLLSKTKDITIGFESFRRNYWITATLFLGVGVFAALVLDSLLLNSILGFIISIIASLITFEMTIKLLIEIFGDKKN